MGVPMITEAELRKWAPKVKSEYLTALLEGEHRLREAGVLDSNLTLCHFMGQIGAETDGLTIVRESLTYTTVARIRAVWPARTRKYSDAWIERNLVRKPVQLGDFAYGGRMGNRKGTSDGFDFRGGGFMQTTGRYAVKQYADALDIEMRNDLLDDHAVTLRFACQEWKESGCCAYAEKNDILAVSRIINTGSAKSGVMPNGLGDRKLWYAKAWKVWGDSRPLPQTADVTLASLKKAGSVTVSLTDTLKKVGLVFGGGSAAAGAAKEAIGPPSAPVTDLPLALISNPEPRSTLETMREWTDYSSAFNGLVGSLKGSLELVFSNFWLLSLALGCVAYFFARRIQQRRLDDARMARNTAGLADPDGSPARAG